MTEAQKVMARKHLAEVQLQLAMPNIQSYDRKTVWLMMRHIEQQEGCYCAAREVSRPSARPGNQDAGEEADSMGTI